jgi:ABC-2 type transport system permease protein
MRLVLAGLRKFRARTASLVAVITAAILVGLEFLLVGVSMSMPAATTGTDTTTMRWLLTFPGAYDAIISIVYVFGGLVALIYVAAVAGTEWTWGTLKVAVTRGESRSRYAVATFGSLAIMLLAGTLIAFVAGVLGVMAGATIAGMPIDGLTDRAAMPHVTVTLLRCWIAVTSLCAAGYAIAMVAKSQMAGVGVVIGMYVASVIMPIALPSVLQDIFKYLPFSVAGDAIGMYGPPGAGGAAEVSSLVEPNLALLVTIGWLIASLAIAAWATERAEISG